MPGLSEREEGPSPLKALLQHLLALSGGRGGVIAELRGGEGAWGYRWLASIGGPAGPDEGDWKPCEPSSWLSALIESEKPQRLESLPLCTCGLPGEPPPFTDCLGFPLHHGPQLIGALGLAGLERDAAIEGLDALLVVAAGLVWSRIEDRARGRLEAALRHGEAQLLRAQRMAGMGSWELDLVSGELRWSEAMYELVGERPGVFRPTLEALLALIFPADRGAFLAGNERFTREGGEREFRIRRRDGGWRTLFEHAVVVEEEEGARTLIGITQDLTELRAADKALRESEERFKSAFTHAPVGMALLDLDGRFRQCNAKLCELTGYSARELERKNYRDITHPEDLPRELALLVKLMTGESPTYTVEKRYVHRQGHAVWALLSRSLVRDENGVPLHFISQILDITERKREEARQEALMKELQRLNQELSSFAYVVSHDLKAPLRGIASLASWLEEDYADRLDAEGREQLGLIAGRTRRMHELIEGILQHAHLGRGREEPRPLMLDALVIQVIQSLAPPPHVRVTVEGPLPTLVGERRQFEMLFENLIGNAVKFQNKPEGRVAIRVQDEGACWRFSIEDNGPGIEERHFERIFEIFQTLRPRDEFESTGIGLTLAKKIVELNGGRIWLESRLGVGTTFHFTFPKHAARQAPLAIDECSPTRNLP